MKLPNAEHAVIEIEKLRDYCLSISHPRGRHKARVFATALGMTAGDDEELRDAIVAAISIEKQHQLNKINMVTAIHRNRS